MLPLSALIWGNKGSGSNQANSQAPGIQQNPSGINGGLFASHHGGGNAFSGPNQSSSYSSGFQKNPTAFPPVSSSGNSGGQCGGNPGTGYGQPSANSPGAFVAGHTSGGLQQLTGTPSTGVNCHPPQGGSAGIDLMGMNPSASQHLGGTTPSGVNLGAAPAPQINILENQITHLNALLGKLQTYLNDLWREKGEDIVKINSQTFTGLSDWRLFYAPKGPSTTTTPEPFHIYFVDFISILVWAAGSDLSILEELSLDQKSGQISNEPGLAAVHQKSYDLILPPQFGKSLSAKSNVSNSKATYTDRRLLPMFKSFDDFAGENRSTSAMYHILQDMKNAQEGLIQGIDCQGQLGLLAMLLINAAQNFMERIFQ